MTSAQRTWTLHAGRLLMLVTFAVTPSCTPIPAPPLPGQPASPLDRPPLAKGDRLDELALLDSNGRAVTLDSLRDHVTVMLLVSPAVNNGNDYRELVHRTAAVEQRLRPNLRDRFRALVLVLEDRPTAIADARRHLPAEAERWRVVVGPGELLLDLANGLGVVAWEVDGELGQTHRTVVVDGEGRIADWFTGLEDWRESDLLAAVAAAAR